MDATPAQKIPAEKLAEAEARLSGSLARIKAWASMFFVDHGFFRYGYLNLHKVGAKAYRAAQPAPHHFRRFARLGVRTVVNLRGGREFGSYPLEIEACARHAFAYEELRLRSRDAPALEVLEDVAALLDRVEYPILFHCKSGADRSGLMGALYLMLVEGASPTEAKKQLSAFYGHIRQSKTGVLDAFVEAFETAEAEARGRGETLTLLDWARSAYDAKALKQQFRASGWASFISDRLLRRE